MSNATVTPENWTEYKGQAVTAQHVDGETVITGTLISHNSKGWNFNVDGKTVTRTDAVIIDVSTGSVQGIEDPESFDADAEPGSDIAAELDAEFGPDDVENDMVQDDAETDEDDEEDSDADDDDLEEVADDDAESTEGETAEGHTTADLAALFNTSARALRIRLRKMGLGVGKGKTYAFTDDQMDELKNAFTKEPVEA